MQSAAIEEPADEEYSDSDDGSYSDHNRLLEQPKFIKRLSEKFRCNNCQKEFWTEDGLTRHKTKNDCHCKYVFLLFTKLTFDAYYSLML